MGVARISDAERQQEVRRRRAEGKRVYRVELPEVDTEDYLRRVECLPASLGDPTQEAVEHAIERLFEVLIEAGKGEDKG